MKRNVIFTSSIILWLVMTVFSSGTPAQAAANMVVNTFNDELNQDGDCSLREAIESFNNGVNQDRCEGEQPIILAKGVYRLKNNLGPLPVETAVALQGSQPLRGPTTIDGDKATSLFAISQAGDLTISQVNLSHSLSSAIVNQGTLLVQNSFLAHNLAANGSAIYNQAGMATIQNTTIQYNTATNKGGAIFNRDGTLIILNSTLRHNEASQDGGAIFNEGTVTLQNTNLQNNMASNDGGAIFNDVGATVTIDNSTLQDNIAQNYGGAIFNYSHLTVNGSTLSGNTAAAGGGIHNRATANIHDVLISKSTLSANSAFSGGGLLSNQSGGTLRIEQSLIYDNVATWPGGGNGGGLHIRQGEIINSTISGNRAYEQGGGIFFWGGGDIYLSNVTVTENRADFDNNGSGEGGGIYHYDDPNRSENINVQNSIIAGNAVGSGQTAQDTADCRAALLSWGYNLLGISSGQLCTMWGNVGGNLTGTTGTPLNPLLAPLSQAAPSPTAYHALLPGSPALNAGNMWGCQDYQGGLLTVDQRGQNRHMGLARRCDMGAVEQQ